MKIKPLSIYISFKNKQLIQYILTNTKVDNSDINHSRIKCTTVWWFLFLINFMIYYIFSKTEQMEIFL